jgi:hypothetical protein
MEMLQKRTPKMTLLLWIGLSAFFNGTVSDLGLESARAGWEYDETARPPKKHSVYPKPADAPESSEAAPPSRVQVFGKPSSATSAEDYAKMLKEDQSVTPDTPAAPEVREAPVVRGAEVDTEFEALRRKIRTRKTAENTVDTVSDPAPAPAPKSRGRGATPKTSPAYIPPPPPMETEVITPQKPAGKKIKGAKAMPAQEPEAARNDEVNEAFPYTQLLPSPANLPHGSFEIGTSFGYGIFDFLQVSTNAVRLVNGYLNIEAKVPLVEYPTFVASAFVNYESYNPHHFEDTNPNERHKAWQPGLVTGYEITPDIAFFLGGNFNFESQGLLPVNTTSGNLHGAQVNMEWSWLYNPSTSKLGNNALALGLRYDFTYSMFGFGVTHHWKMFKAGVEYTFADRAKFLPIFGFNVGTGF